MPSSINGLTISFDNTKPTADYKRKANEYIANPEFDHFLASAAKFGFFVDKNFPYSIVADLESPIMRSYAKKRGYFSLNEIFDKCYFKAYTADLESLKNVVLMFWNSYAHNSQVQIVDKKDKAYLLRFLEY